MAGKRPTFLGIGAHKAGTSWLHRQLAAHPDIWMPPVKELHFFDRSTHYPSPNTLATLSWIDRVSGVKPWERRQFISGLNNIVKCSAKGRFDCAFWWCKWTFGFYDNAWYSSLFSQAKTHKASGEVTPAYSILEDDDIAQIRAVNPEMKIIFMIRNPIDRAWSAIRYNAHRKMVGFSIDSDEEVIAELKKKRFGLRGDYEGTIDRFLNYFNSSQILVCFYDAIQLDPFGLMSGITTFLEIDPFAEKDIRSDRRINTSPKSDMSDNVRDFLREHYSASINRLAERLGSYAISWDEAGNGVGKKEGKLTSDIGFAATLHPSGENNL